MYGFIAPKTKTIFRCSTSTDAPKVRIMANSRRGYVKTVDWFLYLISLVVIIYCLPKSYILIERTISDIKKVKHEYGNASDQMDEIQKDLNALFEEEHNLKLRTVKNILRDDQFHIKQMCAMGNIDGFACSDIEQIDLNEGLEIMLNDPYFINYAKLYDRHKKNFLGTQKSFERANKQSLLDEIENRRSILVSQGIEFFAILTILVFSTWVQFDSLIRRPKRNLCFVFAILLSIKSVIIGWTLILKHNKWEDITDIADAVSLGTSRMETWNDIQRRLEVVKYHWIFCFLYILRYIIQEEVKCRKVTIDYSAVRLWCSRGSKHDLSNLKELLEQAEDDLDVNMIIRNNTLLHLAVMENNTQVVQLLVSTYPSKLDISIRNDNQFNALELAVIKGNNEIFQLLLGISGLQNLDTSVMISAIENGRFKMIEMLMTKLPSGIMAEVIDPIEKMCALARDKNPSKESKAQIEAYKNVAIHCLRNYNTVNEATEDNELECSSCMEEMVPPMKIYACTEDHLICDICMNKWKVKSNTCPECRQDFSKFPPKRRLDYESRVAKI